MRGINKITILGNVGKDPELRYAANGSAVCTFSVATSEDYKNKEGELIEHSEWHRITAFGKLAEICSQFLQKGTQVYLEGKNRTTKFEKEGVTRYSTNIVADVVLALNNRKQSDQEQPRRPSGSAPGGRPPVDDSGIPF